MPTTISVTLNAADLMNTDINTVRAASPTTNDRWEIAKATRAGRNSGTHAVYDVREKRPVEVADAIQSLINAGVIEDTPDRALAEVVLAIRQFHHLGSLRVDIAD